MILFPNTRIVQSVERPVATGFTVDQEGQCLVATQVGGVYGVKKSAGAASTEVFVGVSHNMLKTVTSLAFQETLVQGGANTITLTYTPTSTAVIYLFDQTSSTVQTVGNPGTTANQYSLSGNVITLNAAQTGHTYLVAYRFAPTVPQALALFGNVHPGGAAGDYLGQIGVIQKGDVFTTEYDTSVDWTVASPIVKSGANGQFTIGGSGATLSNVTVIAAPSAGVGVLGLEIR